MLIQHPVHQGEMGKKQIIPTCIFLFACSISLMADINKIIPVVSNSFTEWNIAVMEISEKPLNALNTTSYMITSAYTLASLVWKPVFSCPRAIPYSHAKFCKSQWISSSSHHSLLTYNKQQQDLPHLLYSKQTRAFTTHRRILRELTQALSHMIWVVQEVQFCETSNKGQNPSNSYSCKTPNQVRSDLVSI